jgi:solute carrier family 29 (equilibrative nucleoside transporter), member 1/2/3
MSGKQILLQNVDYVLDVFLIYTLPLSIVPGFVAEDIGTHNLGSWYLLILLSLVADLFSRKLFREFCIAI